MIENQFDDLLIRFQTHLKTTGLLTPGQSLVVAVSGGMDSMCLLSLLRKIRNSWKLSITIGHVNHNLRPSADNDREFVENISNMLDLPFLVKTLNPSTRKLGESKEAWARNQRYGKLESIRKKVRADLIATAHHGNDQVETILMHLGQGSGLKGLRGIHPKINNIIRPLLPFSRQEIESFVNRHNILYIEDETNQDLAIPRNFLRHEIIRKWQTFNPALVSAFESVSKYAEETDAALDFVLDQIVDKLAQEKNNGAVRVNTIQLESLPILLQVRLIQKLSGDSKSSWRSHQWKELKTFLKHSQTGQVLTLPDGWSLLKDRQHWILQPERNSSNHWYEILPGETVDCGDFYFIWNWVPKAQDLGENSWREVIDGATISKQTYKLRPWRPGDDFQPLGMEGRKKVSDFLVDNKMDRFSKEHQMVLTADEEIIWVCGQRISDRVKVTPQTTEFVELLIKKRE